jgi:hypothetical protein
MNSETRYPSPEVLPVPGMQTPTMGLAKWPATDLTPEHFSIGWANMSAAQVRAFGRQLLQIASPAGDAAVPEGDWQVKLDYLKMAFQGYDYLLIDPQPGLAAWQAARARGLRRIVAACLAVAAAVPDEEQENPS